MKFRVRVWGAWSEYKEEINSDKAVWELRGGCVKKDDDGINNNRYSVDDRPVGAECDEIQVEKEGCSMSRLTVEERVSMRQDGPHKSSRLRQSIYAFKNPILQRQ